MVLGWKPYSGVTRIVEFCRRVRHHIAWCDGAQQRGGLEADVEEGAVPIHEDWTGESDLEVLRAANCGPPEAFTELRRRFAEEVRGQIPPDMPDQDRALVEADVWEVLENKKAQLASTIQDFLEQTRVAVEDAAAWRFLESWKAGDASALGRICALLNRWLRGVIRGILSEEADVLDVIQTVCMKFAKTPPRRLPLAETHSMTPLRAFVKVIALNAARDVARRNNREEPLDDQGAAVVQDHPEPGRVLPYVIEGARLIGSLTKPPHHTIAYILNKWLELAPAEIALKYSGRPLREIVGCLPRELARGEGTQRLTEKTWDGILDPLRKSMDTQVANGKELVGDTRMTDHTPSQDPAVVAVAIRHWVNATQKRFAAEINNWEQVALQGIFGHEDPYLAISFGFVRMLRIVAEAYVFESNKVLAELAGGLKTTYTTEAQKRKGLAPDIIRSCFTALDRELGRMLALYVRSRKRRELCLRRGAKITADTVLNDYYCAVDAPDKVDELKRWCMAVRRRFLENGQGTLFAYKQGWV